MGELSGKVVVITGASRGIGRAIATRFAREGARLGLIARDQAALAETLVTTGDATVCSAIADVSDARAVHAAIAQLRASLGPVDILVNNAGIVVRDDVLAMSEAEWLQVHAVNTHGPFWLVRACGADLRERRGRVINIASIAGEFGTAKLAAYCSSKHAVIGFTRALAKEWADARVMVVAICPGSVDTDMLKIGMPHGKPDMTPDDIAEVALFLASRAPYAMTGGCVDVHG